MHEQSQTIERDGQYFNISGVTGETLEGPFPDLETAVQSAQRRSASFDGDPSLADPRQADADVPDQEDAPESGFVGGGRASGTPGAPMAAQPPFRLDDLTTAPQSYWDELYNGYETGTITSDDVYLQQRQHQHDLESPLLQAQREQALADAEAAPKPPDERGAVPPLPDDPLGQRSFNPRALRDAAMLTRDAEGNIEVNLETTKPPPPLPENLFPQSAKPPTPTRFGWTAEDTDIVRGAIRGPLKTVDAVGSLAAYLAEQMTGFDLSRIKDASVAETVLPGGEPTTTLGGLAQGFTQYMAIAAPVGMAIKAALTGAEVAASLPEFVSVAGPAGETLQVAVSGAAAGVKSFGQRILHWALTAEGADVAADFLAFDARDPRMANMLNEFFPGYANVVSDYLAAKGDDSELEGRLKNVIEGRIINATVAASVFASIKGMKLAREAVAKVPLPELDHEVLSALDRIESPSTVMLRSETGGARIPGPEGQAPIQPVKKEKVLRGPRTPPKPPSLDRDLTYAEMGKGSGSWYHGVGDYVKRKLGTRDGNVFLDFMAIASQGQKAGISDLNIAIDTFNRFRRGENPADLVEELKIGNVTGPNIRKHLLAYMTGTKLTNLFGEDALKIRDYRRALDGDKNVVVVDRWMWRTYYPDDWDAAKAKFTAAEEIAYPQRVKEWEADPAAQAKYQEWNRKRDAGTLTEKQLKKGPPEPKQKVFSAWEGSNYQYRMIQDRVTTEAKRMGLAPSDLQAQIWAGIKLATEGPNATGLKPMRDMVEARFKKGEIQRLPGQSVAALIRSESVTRIAGIVAGIVAGHYYGDTDEEKASYALLAMGIGGVGGRRLAHDIANLVPAAGSLRNTMVAEEGALKRVYHGTTRTFREFDPAKVDESALYGPGFYHTEDPLIAGGTGGGRQKLGYATPSVTRESERVAAEEVLKTLRHEADLIQTDPTGAAARFKDPAQRLRDIEGSIRHAENTLRQLESVAPQVRPAYLDIQRPFDIDKYYSPQEVDRIGAAIGIHPTAEDIATVKADMDRLHDAGAWRLDHPDHELLLRMHDIASKESLVETISGKGKELKGQSIYDALSEAFNGDRAQVNIALEQVGYDGITHIGGARTGSPEHRVWIAFHPEQVHSAFEVAANARLLAKQAEEAAAGAGPARAISGGGPAIVTPDDPRSMAQQYAEAVIEARRGGPRTHELVQQEAQNLITQKLVSWDWIKSLVPGTTLADAPTVALVNMLAESGLKMRALTKQALAATDPVEALAHARAVVQQLWVHANLDPKRIGVLTESGRTLSALNDPTSGLNAFLQQFEVMMRDQNAALDPMAVVKAINELQDPGQLAAFAKQATKPGFWQMFNEYYVNGLLWGPKTWMANFLGNSGATLWAIPERALAARLPGGAGGVQAGEAVAMMEGLTTSIVSAWRLAWDAFKKGESQFEQAYGTGLVKHGDKIEGPRRAISSQTFNMVGPAGQAVDAIGNTIRFPMRVLASTDDFFKVINYNMELSAVASREARAKLLPANFKSPKDYAAAVEAEKARIMADPPLSVKKAAESFALYQTFTKELGPGGQLIQEWANTVPGGRILAPIVRTPINIFKYAGERTPLALATTSFWKTINGPDQVAADLAKSRVALGSMTMGVAAMMAYGGLITGKGPSDPQEREKLEKVGWKPYSMRVGNLYIGINRLEPVGMLLTLAADYVDAVVNSDATTIPQWAGEAAWALTVTTAKATASRTFVQGMAETMAFMSNPDRMSDQFASRFLQSLLPMSGLLRQTAGALDPTMREAEGVLDRICAVTPGCSATLPPQRTLLDAEPLWLTGAYGPIGISRGAQDKEMNTIIELGVHVPKVPDIIDRGIELHADEKDYWVVQRGTMEIAGKTLRERIAARMASDQWKRGNNEMRAEWLETDIQLYHDRAKDQMLKKYDVIKQSIREAERAENAARHEGRGDPMPTSPLLRSLTR